MSGASLGTYCQKLRGPDLLIFLRFLLLVDVAGNCFGRFLCLLLLLWLLLLILLVLRLLLDAVEIHETRASPPFDAVPLRSHEWNDVLKHFVQGSLCCGAI